MPKITIFIGGIFTIPKQVVYGIVLSALLKFEIFPDPSNLSPTNLCESGPLRAALSGIRTPPGSTWCSSTWVSPNAYRGWGTKLRCSGNSVKKNCWNPKWRIFTLGTGWSWAKTKLKNKFINWIVGWPCQNCHVLSLSHHAWLLNTMAMNLKSNGQIYQTPRYLDNK